MTGQNVVPMPTRPAMTAMQSYAGSLDQWVTGWWWEFMAYRKVPERVIPMLPEAVRRAQLLCPPADLKFFAVQMDRIRRFARAFNLPKLDVEDATEMYHSALGQLPNDLLDVAISRMIASHENHFALPLPKEIMDRVRFQFQERRQILTRLEMAQKSLNRQATSD